MPAPAYFALKFVHLLGMAIWVGGPMFAPYGLSRASQQPALGFEVVRRLSAITPWFVGAALLTVLSGTGLVIAGGGFSQVRPAVLVGAGLSLLTFPIGGAVIRPALRDLEQALGAAADPTEIARGVRRFWAAHHTEQTLRLAALFLMVVRF